MKKFMPNKFLLFAGIALSIASCTPTEKSEKETDIAFLAAFPKRSVNLSWVLGEQLTLVDKNGDTINLNISFDRKTRLNHITLAPTGDTLLQSYVSRFRNYYYFSSRIADSAFQIHAVKHEDSLLRGLFDGPVQMQRLASEVKYGGYPELVRHRDDEHKKYRLDFDRIKLRNFYQGLADTLPELRLLDAKHPEQLISDTIPAAEIQKHFSINGGPVKNLFPNPASDHFTIEFAEVGVYQLDMYNDAGSLVKTQKTNSPTIRIQIEELKAGIYFIRVKETDTGENATFKLIVKR